MKRVAGAQDALERQLSILEVHQREVHEALEGMEREAEALYGQEREGRRADDVAHERDRLFELAEDVSQQLLDIGAALRETIQLVRPRRGAPPRVAALLTSARARCPRPPQVNSQAASTDPAADPVSAAVQILNNQLSSLVWIDSQAKVLQQRVEQSQH